MDLQSADENRLIEEMQTILQNKMIKDYAAGNTKRDAHPKCLGLAKANFTVSSDIPDALKVGIFKTPKSYNAWIRFSNASNKVQSDKQADFRGFAIKLLDVHGERFTEDEQQTQDFLLMSHPTMPLGTVKLFRDAIYYSIKWNPLVLVLKMLFSGNGHILKTLKNGKKNDSSPLDIHYWSTTPYALGEDKVKYKVVPTSATRSRLPETLTDDYLTQNMAEHLNNSNASFDFYIQQFNNEQTTPIEDAAVEWSEEDSPFIKVATIDIPTQVLNTETRFELAEQLSFSPANALSVHKPIGGLNRARNIIYSNLSKFRHDRNSKKQIEPKPEDYQLTD